MALPYLPVLCERGHSSALSVGLGQAGADLQQVGLAWLGDHHGVVQGGRGALGGVLLLLMELERGLGTQAHRDDVRGGGRKGQRG